MSMNRFDFEKIGVFADDLKSFLDSFAEICYAIGGSDLIQSVQTEMEFHVSQGHPVAEVAGALWQDFKQSNITKGTTV